MVERPGEVTPTDLSLFVCCDQRQMVGDGEADKPRCAANTTIPKYRRDGSRAHHNPRE